MIQPYRQEVDRTMNEVVGFAPVALEKKQPEGTLGNFMADALLERARAVFLVPVDAAVVNFGGIRLNQLPAGPVTNGKIFELMPFDNLLVLQKLKGDVLQRFLNLTAARGGWPVAGITLEIRGQEAIRVRIGGRPLDTAAVYTIANSDFVANGGDNADMLRGLPQISNGYLVRDALFDHIKNRKSAGKSIVAEVQQRVIYAE
jgi:2',3'-cyclic-nucleotide 2'-phosphodiesterase (5'-nucleotidase family)